MMAENRALARLILREYNRHFCRAFPFKNEREPLSVYDDYLRDRKFPWNILVMMEEGEIVGGAHYQHLPVSSDSVIFAEHFWLRGRSWRSRGYRSQDRFAMLGRQVEEVAKSSGAKAIIWECNDPLLMSAWQRRLDRKAGLPTEKRNLLWSRYGRVLDVYYAQPRLLPDEDPCEFLMLCIRKIDPAFAMTGRFFRTMFRNFVLTFNDNPDEDETYRRVIERSSKEVGDDEIVNTIPFRQPRSYLVKTSG